MLKMNSLASIYKAIVVQNKVWAGKNVWGRSRRCLMSEKEFQIAMKQLAEIKKSGK